MAFELNTLLPHICPSDAWQAALLKGEYHTASLLQEGFIHFSTPEQVLVVANNFYRGAKDLVLLWVAPERLHAELRWDLVENTHFPHLYGPLNLDAVVAISPFPCDSDGQFRALPIPDLFS